MFAFNPSHGLPNCPCDGLPNWPCATCPRNKLLLGAMSLRVPKLTGFCFHDPEGPDDQHSGMRSQNPR